MLALALLVIGILSRTIIHAPNFTPVLALALFGGMFLKKEQAVWLPLGLMALSDMVLGMHAAIAFTWGSVLLISLLGYWQRDKNNRVGYLFGGSLLAAIIFFVVSNFGAWLVMYPKTWEGLAECYVMAIPFFRNTLASTVVYTGVLFGVHELIARRVRGTKLAWVVS